MRNVLIVILLCWHQWNITAQNIGIDVANPEFKLDIGSSLALRHPASGTAGIMFDGTTQPTKTFLGMIDDDRFGIKSNLSNTWPLQINVTNGFVGLGEVSPSFNLDIKGRPRLRYNGTNSPGIWFDGSSAAQSSFVGTFDNNHTGIFANGLWNMVMNVNNGNIGIGTVSPTSKLDVNGGFRMRSSFPKTGAIMTSSDANGNAEWEDPIAFKAVGTYDNEPFLLTSSTNSTKIYFNQLSIYNIGFGYQANNSQFVAQVDGVYHFEVALDWTEGYTSSNIILKLQRNNTVITIAEERHGGSGFNWPFERVGVQLQPSTLNVDFKLLEGDIIWAEAYFIKPQYANLYNWISPNPTKTWFTGHLVSRI